MSTSPDRTVAGLVGDRYEITGLIATGGMGSVYRARDTVLDRTVALKVLKAGGGDPEFVRRFREEATNAARLSHPNIVQVYDFGSADGSPFMAMEYVDGQTLREILHTRGVLRPELAARIAAQVAQALEYARRAGLVHRDIKPENILITTEGQVKVADFGLSRPLAESTATQSGVLIGTAHYLAPERVEGTRSDHRADIYSLGVVLFEMLTGRPPFEGDSPVVIAYKRVAEDVPSPMATNPSVPRELDMVVARATARRPDARYATGAEMAEALRAAVPRFDTGELGALVHHTEAIPIVGQETVALGKKKKPERTTKQRRKRRRLIVAVAALMLIGSAAVAVTNRLATVPVSGVLDMAQQDARRALERQGFRVEVVLQNHPQVDGGRVIRQDPLAGVKARKGSLVQLFVSLGPKLITLPDVRGKKLDDARSQLQALGFTTIVPEYAFDPRIAKGKVVSQKPESNLPVEAGATITLVVSKGPEMVPVPDVEGDPIASARTDLEAAGFVLDVEERYDETVAKDRVISQSPDLGTKAEKGSTVKLVVSKGPPLVAVPDLYCKTRAQAGDILAAKGFDVSFDGSGRYVVDQDPAAGRKAPKGSTVTAFTAPGSRC